MIYDLIILGAGAAGLFLGANLKNKNALIIEKGAKVGRKILASGGGRCNITNANLSPDCYLGDEKFVAQILQNLRPNELLKWFAPLKFNLEKNAQYFCKSGARAVLEQILRKIRVPIRTNCEICEISKEGENFILFAKNGEKFITKKLVIATGGASFGSKI